MFLICASQSALPENDTSLPVVHILFLPHTDLSWHDSVDNPVSQTLYSKRRVANTLSTTRESDLRACPGGGGGGGIDIDN